MPQEVLEGCGRLWLLALAANPISAEQLRAAPGWAAYDARRRAKADKQVGAGGRDRSPERAAHGYPAA